MRTSARSESQGTAEGIMISSDRHEKQDRCLPSIPSTSPTPTRRWSPQPLPPEFLHRPLFVLLSLLAPYSGSPSSKLPVKLYTCSATIPHSAMTPYFLNCSAFSSNFQRSTSYCGQAAGVGWGHGIWEVGPKPTPSLHPELRVFVCFGYWTSTSDLLSG